MPSNKRGRRTFVLPHMPVITHWATVADKKEGEGPLGRCFDTTLENSRMGEKSWEQAEQAMQKQALQTLLRKAGLSMEQIGTVLSGDLLNQCTGSSFSLRNTGLPHLGLYGACSTMAESLLLSAVLVSGGFSDRVIAMTSSHFASSERQYRFPLGYGGQRTPTAQWTVTGAGAALVCSAGTGPRIHSCTVGAVTDLGVTDPNNMGAAMAPAALDTVAAYLEDMNAVPEDLDLIVTGDLGEIGKECLLELARRRGLSLGGRLMDCGCMIFDRQRQDVHSGGSGCGCSAVTLCGHFLEELNRGKLKKILFCGTGALLSPTSTQQGLSIPGICHAVCIHGKE